MGSPASPVERPLRVGVIGIGFGQAAHVPAFRSIPGALIQGIAASDYGRAKRVAERLSIPDAFGSWQDLLAERIDAVTIAVPPDLQPDIVRAAAVRGIHVFCEKPLAADLTGAAAALDAALGAGIVHAIDFEFPELDEWRSALEIVAEGRLGHVQVVRIVWHVRAGSVRSSRSSWKAIDTRGGGAIGGFLAHAVHHGLRFLGEERVTVRSVEVRRDGAETKRIDLVAGTAASEVAISVWVDHDGPPCHTVEAEGPGGKLTLTNTSPLHGGPFALRLDGQDIGTAVATQDDRRVHAVARIARRFALAIDGSGSVAPSLVDGLRVQEVLATISREAT